MKECWLLQGVGNCFDGQRDRLVDTSYQRNDLSTEKYIRSAVTLGWYGAKEKGTIQARRTVSVARLDKVGDVRK